MSAIFSWVWIHLAYYHKNGIFSNSKPRIGDIFIVMIPLINSIASLLSWIFYFPINFESKFSLTEWFFRKPRNKK